jgi:hypothetical protein
MSIVDPPEGTTPIDADEAGLLKLTHITTRGELNRWEQDNIVEALTWLDKTKSSDILNASRASLRGILPSSAPQRYASD